MIKINKIENDSKNILVNDAVMPAVFVATAIGDLVRIVSTQRLVPGVSSHGIHYSLIEINDEACESANDAVQKLNAFIGSFKSGGGGISPEVLKGYVKEVPNPEIVGSEIVETNIKAGYYEAMGIASNGKTYFCGRSNNGIKVLDDDTGIIEDTNITSSFYKAMGIASNDRTYFCGGAGIKVLNDDTGIIEDTNITSGYYEAMGIASDDRTYFCGSSSNGIKVLDDDTGIIEETNITTGNYKAIGTASNGKTYFCSNDSNGGIKVLNKDTGIIEYTNIVLGFYVAIGTASNGKTYFCGGSIRVLNDETEEIEYTNVTDVSFCAMGIASNGKTYFCGSGRGIMVLQPVYADEKYVRRYGEWLPALGADAFNNDFTTDVDFVISEDGDTVVAEQFYKNPATGETKQIDKVIPLADATHAGLMSKEQAQGATDSANAINNLDNKDVAIYEGGEYKYVTLKDLDKDYQGLATDTYVDQKVLESQQKSFEFEGSVDTFEDLPVNPKLGDVYYVSADDTDYYWNGTEWKAWQPEVDLSEYYKTSEVDSLLSTKADNTPTFTEATSRTNIASGDSAVTMWGKIRKFFTDLKAVAFSGSYNDLTDKPNIDFQLNVEQKMGYKFLGQDVYAKLVMAVSPDVSSTGRGYSTSIIIDEAALFVDARGFSTGNTVSSAFSQMAGYIKRSGGQRGNAATTGIEECFSIEFGYGATNRYLWVNWSTGYTTYMSGVQTAYIIVYYTKVAPTL